MVRIVFMLIVGPFAVVTPITACACYYTSSCCIMARRTAFISHGLSDSYSYHSDVHRYPCYCCYPYVSSSSCISGFIVILLSPRNYQDYCVLLVRSSKNANTNSKSLLLS